MKSYLAHLLLFAFSLNSLAMVAPENPQDAGNWYQSMESGVAKWAASTDKPAQIENLGDYVRKFGEKVPNHPDPRWHKVYEEAQEALLAIPGHAHYFADELERLRPDPKSNYELFRPKYLAETLKGLPSPETIQVLGHYLSDMRDAPYDENPKYIEAVRSGKIRPSDSTPLPQNAWLATYALSNVGLRNPPFEPVGNYIFLRFSPSAESLPKFRAWWEEVKSGKRTFSFVGQTVEYRFKPDGSWETVTIATPPDDKPKLPDAAHPQRENEPEKERIAKPRPAERGPAAEVAPGYVLWKWATAGFFMLIVAGLWAKLRRA